MGSEETILLYCCKYSSELCAAHRSRISSDTTAKAIELQPMMRLVLILLKSNVCFIVALNADTVVSSNRKEYK